MAYFTDDGDLYDTIGRLLLELRDDQALVARCLSADTIVRYEYSDPEAAITVRIKEGEPARVDLGASVLEPEIVFSMDADLAHRFWLGEVNVTIALARGQLRATGPVTKVLRLLPLMEPVQARYRELLEERERADLARVPAAIS